MSEYLIESIPNKTQGKEKYQVVTLWNTDYAEEIISEYKGKLYDYISQKGLNEKDIRSVFDNLDCGHIWKFVLLGIVCINKSGKVSEYGELHFRNNRIFVGENSFSDERLWTNMPTTNSYYGKIAGKLKSCMWWILIGVSVYYVLSELISLIF